MPSQQEIRQQITSTIVESLKTGNLPPWRQPWRCSKNAGAPANVVTKRGYSGVNPLLLAAISTTLALASAAFGYLTYRDGLAVADKRANKAPFLHRLVLNKYYVDEAVEAVILAPLRGLGNALWKYFDVVIIDGLIVNVPGAVALVAGDFAALGQTGRVRNYVLCMVLGALLLLCIFLR